MCLVYDGNYPTGRARSNETCKFPQRPSFDLFRPKEPGSSHSGPSLIYSLGQWDERIHTSRLYDTKGPIITCGKAVLCIIGLWLFHRKKILTMSGPICSIVIMA